MDSVLVSVLVLLLGIGLLASAQPLDTGWQPAQCAPADLPPQDLFDLAQIIDDFEGGELTW